MEFRMYALPGVTHVRQCMSLRSSSFNSICINYYISRVWFVWRGSVSLDSLMIIDFKVKIDVVASKHSHVLGSRLEIS